MVAVAVTRSTPAGAADENRYQIMGDLESAGSVRNFTLTVNGAN
jgi:hypothetical protein